jgi:hypothetical protein
MFPAWARPGHGLELKEKDAEKFLAWQHLNGKGEHDSKRRG